MTRPVQTFVVAVKRERRETAPADWISQVRNISGVTVRGKGNPHRILIEATPEAVLELQKRFGDLCHIEVPVRHRPS
jgi:hypothetical protein